jgi:hypothetical protein
MGGCSSNQSVNTSSKRGDKLDVDWKKHYPVSQITGRQHLSNYFHLLFYYLKNATKANLIEFPNYFNLFFCGHSVF